MARRDRDAPRELLLTAQELGEEAGRPGVEAGHSEVWASEPADPAGHWLGETEDAPRELLLTAQEPGKEAGQPGVEAGHSEAWASEPADLARHRLGGTEDASKGPIEEVGRPRLQEESSKVPREQAPQGGGNSSRTRHHADLHRSEDRLKEAVEAELP